MCSDALLVSLQSIHAWNSILFSYHNFILFNLSVTSYRFTHSLTRSCGKHKRPPTLLANVVPETPPAFRCASESRIYRPYSRVELLNARIRVQSRIANQGGKSSCKSIYNEHTFLDPQEELELVGLVRVGLTVHYCKSNTRSDNSADHHPEPTFLNEHTLPIVVTII